jgi:Tol biopolymer transport system component
VLLTSSPPTLHSQGQSTLWRATQTGAATRLLSRAGASGLSAPAISPDGKHVAYVVDGIALWQMDIDGTHARELYSLSATGFERIIGPRYGPNSLSISFTAGCCGRFTVYEISTDSKHLHQILAGGLRIFQDWAPPGTHLLFTMSGALWTADARGANNRPLGGDAPDAGTFSDASYSPDSTHIVSDLIPAVGQEAAAGVIVLLHSDGQYLSFLTNNLPYEVGTPSWSPDGKTIAFTAASGVEGALGRNRDLWMMRYDGAQKRNITRGRLGNVVDVAWAR